MGEQVGAGWGRANAAAVRAPSGGPGEAGLAGRRFGTRGRLQISRRPPHRAPARRASPPAGIRPLPLAGECGHSLEAVIASPEHTGALRQGIRKLGTKPA